MIVSRSMNYSLCGRRKKKLKPFKVREKREEGPIPTFKLSYGLPPRGQRVIKSLNSMASQTTVTKESGMKLQESKNFTVAPAYNKGAYQVISPSNIEHIGK